MEGFIEIKTLKKPEEKEAQQMLMKAAGLVQPIMKSRSWKVKLLTEFYPKNKSLLGLNVNRGQKICVRIRDPNNESSFLPYNEVLGTLLHELAHMQVGPHNAQFYKLLDTLWTEAEELMDKGYTGYAPGEYLGKGLKLDPSRHNPSKEHARKKALEAARRRALTCCAPKATGGDRTKMLNHTPAQMAAAAAEQRRKDAVWCATMCNGGDAGTENSTENVTKLAKGHQSEIDGVMALHTVGADGGEVSSDDDIIFVGVQRREKPSGKRKRMENKEIENKNTSSLEHRWGLCWREMAKCEPSETRLTIQCLLVILKNILDNPTVPKYRKLKYDNPGLLRKIWSVPPAVSCLELARFQRGTEAHELSDDDMNIEIITFIESKLRMRLQEIVPD
eukprot:m.25869 g.25869  ORF g.25869 m.25869 type:complete len:390 (+) comp7744_c0_seq2:102-1271(+)